MNKTLQLFVKFWMTLFSYSISLNWSWICFCSCYSALGRSCAKRSACRAKVPSLSTLPMRCWVKGWVQISTLRSCWRLCAFGWHVDVGRDYILCLNRILLYLTGLPVIINYKLKNLKKLKRNSKNSSIKIDLHRINFHQDYLDVWNRTNIIPPCWDSSELRI